MIDDYALLGVSPNVSEDELRAAFLFLAKKFHPDANPGNEKQAAEHFKNVEAAYFRIRLRLSQAQSGESNQAQSGERKHDPPKEANSNPAHRQRASGWGSSPPAAPAPSSPPRPEESKSSSGNWFVVPLLVLVVGGVIVALNSAGKSGKWPGYPQGPPAAMPSTTPPSPPDWKHWVTGELLSQSWGKAVCADAYAGAVELRSALCPPPLNIKLAVTSTAPTTIEAVVLEIIFTDLFDKVIMSQKLVDDTKPIQPYEKATMEWTIDGFQVPAEYKNAGRFRYTIAPTKMALKNGEIFKDALEE